MKTKIIEKGRVGSKMTLNELSTTEMEKITGGEDTAICLCDRHFCLDCSCVEIGPLCICDVKRNCN